MLSRGQLPVLVDREPLVLAQTAVVEVIVADVEVQLLHCSPLMLKKLSLILKWIAMTK